MICPQCNEYWPLGLMVQTPAGLMCEGCHDMNSGRSFHRIGIEINKAELGVEDERNKIQRQAER